jgi:hypothetical protein
MAEAKNEQTQPSAPPQRGADRRQANTPLPAFLNGEDRRRGGDRRLRRRDA